MHCDTFGAHIYIAETHFVWDSVFPLYKIKQYLIQNMEIAKTESCWKGTPSLDNYVQLQFI